MTLDFIIITITIACVVRALVSYLVLETGPYEILTRIRFMMGVNVLTDEDGTQLGEPEENYIPEQNRIGMHFSSNGSISGDIFDCPFCMSPYATLIVTVLLWLWSGNFEIITVTVSGLSALGIVHKTFSG